MSTEIPRHDPAPPAAASAKDANWKSLTVELLPLLLNAFREYVNRRDADAPPQPCETLTLPEVVRFFAAHRAESPQAAAGAVLRAPDGGATRVDLMFLDAAHKPLLSGPGTAATASYLARRLDPELAAAFGKTDIIVLD